MGLEISGTTTSKRRRRSTLRRRILYCAVSLAGAVLLGAILVRQVGIARVDALQADIRARGGRASLGDYLEDIRIDPALQEKYWSWQERWCPSGWRRLGSFEDALWSWALSTRGESPPRKLLEEIKRQDAYFEEGRALLACPGLSMSFRAFAKLDCPEDASMEAIERIRQPSWTVQAEFARWLTMHALLADDPTPWLDDLDMLLHREAGHDFSPYHSSLAGLRETAYLLTAVRGKTTPERLGSWAGEPFHWEAILRRQLERDRCLYWAPAVGRAVFRETATFRERDTGGWYRRASDSWASDSGLRPIVAFLEGAWEWMVIPYDVARGMEWTWRAEQQLGGEGARSDSLPDPSSEPYLTAHGRLCDPRRSSLDANSYRTLWTRMRSLRAGALIIYTAVHESRGLPADSSEVESRWPGSLGGREPRDIKLSYHRLSPSRFLISISDAPAAPAGEPEREPTGSLRLYRTTASGCEFRLAARMVPVRSTTRK